VDPPPLAGDWPAVALVVLATLVVRSVRAAPWARLATAPARHVYFGATLAVTLLWLGTARVGAGLSLHLLGATILYLMFGGPLAVLAVTVAGATATLVSGGAAGELALRVLAAGILPVAVSHAVLRTAEARLPPNFFVYVFVAAFLGGALAMAATGLVAAGALALAGAPATAARGAFVELVLLLGFGEATLTGMLLTIFVVYRPAWVATFSDARYLRRGR
jgi:uncharacterized membrane protein